MIHQIGSRLVTVAAALSISGPALAKESPRQKPAERSVQVRQQETVTKLQACMNAGFDGYVSQRRMVSGEMAQANGWLQSRKSESGEYISGGRITEVVDTSRRIPPIQISEVFMDKEGFDGRTDVYIKELSQMEGDDGFKNQAKVCYGVSQVSEADSAQLEKLGISPCTAQISQEKAQSHYEEFLAETLAQCEAKAKTDMGFASKFKTALKKLTKKRK